MHLRLVSVVVDVQYKYIQYIYSGYIRSWGKGDVGENVLLHGPQLFQGVNTVNHLEHFSHKCRLYSEPYTGKKKMFQSRVRADRNLASRYETNMSINCMEFR
jgi:hypothetical protein